MLDDMQLSAEQLKEVVTRYKNVYRTHGHEFPNNPEEQLKLAVQAAFNSWESEQATLYRQMSGIEGLAGTAVTVQVRHDASDTPRTVSESSFASAVTSTTTSCCCSGHGVWELR